MVTLKYVHGTREGGVVFGRNFMILAGGFLQSGVTQISTQTKEPKKKKSMPIEFYYENRAESLINNGIIMSRVEIWPT